jgi:hypothetical protein
MYENAGCLQKNRTKHCGYSGYFWYHYRLQTPRESFFFKNLKFLGLGRQIWLKFYEAFGQTISTVLVLWVPCPWENVSGSLSYRKLVFLGLKHITPKCSQNKILALKNSTFGGYHYWHILSLCIPRPWFFINQPFCQQKTKHLRKYKEISNPSPRIKQFPLAWFPRVLAYGLAMYMLVGEFCVSWINNH